MAEKGSIKRCGIFHKKLIEIYAKTAKIKQRIVTAY